jgi:hypothetical protein
MKTFLVKINAYNYFTEFQVKSNDDPTSLENAILDKLGQNVINWEYTGDMYDSRKHRITYEEVIDGEHDATSKRPLHTKERSGSRMGAGAS